MPRHFLDLAGAIVVPTPQLKLTKRVVPELYAGRAIGAVYGEAGYGKTFSVDAALEAVDVPTIKIVSLLRPTMKGIALSVLEALTGVRHHGELIRLKDDLLVELAGEQRRLIVIDEAQNLAKECFEFLRYLHDDERTNFALLFVGGNRCRQVIDRHPMLSSRIWRRVEFRPFTIEEVRKIIPRYHAIYAGVEVELVLEIDEEFAHGNFRNWASFTKTALYLCETGGLKRISREVVDAAMLLHKGQLDADAAA